MKLSKNFYLFFGITFTINFIYSLIETKDTILNNAIGIIILGFIQGLCAMLGYFIFGINDAIHRQRYSSNILHKIIIKMLIHYFT